MFGFPILWRCFANGVSLSLMLKYAAVHDGLFNSTLKQGVWNGMVYVVRELQAA